MDSKQEILLKNKKNKRLSNILYTMQCLFVLTLGFSIVASFILFIIVMIYIVSIVSGDNLDLNYSLSFVLSLFGGSIGSGILSTILLSFFEKYINDTRSIEYNNKIIERYTPILTKLTKPELQNFLNNYLITLDHDSDSTIRIENFEKDNQIIIYKTLKFNTYSQSISPLIERKYYLNDLNKLLEWYDNYGDNLTFKIYNKLETEQKLSYLKENKEYYVELSTKDDVHALLLTDSENKFIEIYEDIKSYLIKVALDSVQEISSEKSQKLLNELEHANKHYEKTNMSEKEQKIKEKITMGEMLLK